MSDAPLVLNQSGWLAGVHHLSSPNCDDRPAGEIVRLIVVHAISLPPGQFGGPAIEQLFTNRLDAAAHPCYNEIANLRVSAHFLVRRDGAITQFVSTQMRAWHAGISCWRGRERCNDFSLGIELEGDDEHAFAEAQYAALTGLLRALRRSCPIDAVVGHSDIAPGRKSDPGPHFDWSRATTGEDEARC